ncbi:transposase [Saccharothrix australiensis]|uniref:transposase n=1 Tax=Saccharothrix australiensis TaxID=2072 RepID=UPI001476DCD1|nr:transposase [Saccharothrix australiensis]
MPDPLWTVVAPLLPGFRPRPQGGGAVPRACREVFTAVVFVLSSGCAWRRLPSSFDVSPATAHRRFTAWTRAGLWPRLRRALAEDPDLGGDPEWAATIVDAAIRRSGRAPVHRRGGRPPEPHEARWG